MKSLAEKLIRENLESKNPYLDLGKCGLDGTESTLELLGKCDHLKELVLANSWRHRESISYIGQTSKNEGENNNLIQLPNKLPSRLETLIVGNTNDLFYPDVTQHIQDIRSLQSLVHLHYVDLQNNDVVNLQPLQNLKKLNYLNLSNNQIQDIQPLQNLKKLNYLNLSHNQIQDIQSLQSLLQLSYLILSSNPVQGTDILNKLEQLIQLDLSKSQVEDIQFLQNLHQLDYLHLSNNQIRDIRVLQNLQKLTRLYLYSNQIQDIHPLQNLHQLAILNLENNQIQDIQPLRNLQKLTHIFLKNNQVQNVPSEIINGSPQLIINYLKSVEKSENQKELNEAKLIFVGVGEVGKTELAEAISNKHYNFTPERQTTKGIQIKAWQPEDFIREGKPINFTANIWDFAGQEINYGTHQFFLTKNSVYVFVWTTRKGEDNSDFNYWLRIVSLLSNDSPIFVVQNKVDEYQGVINQQKWQERFSNIQGFLRTSCKTGEGVALLREQIKSTLVNLPHIKEIWNKDRFVVRQFLENHRVDYITYREYLKICTQHRVNQEDARFLSQQLHDIGVILHFGEDARLTHTIVLKPQWATRAAYLLRDSDIVKAGKFHVNDLNKVWKEDRFQGQYLFLLLLMQKFELIFQLQESDEYIIPDLLPHETPSFVQHIVPPSNTPRHLRLEYHYEFMPKGILSRFICRIHEHIYKKLYWQYGVVLKLGQSFAKVIWDDTAIIKTIKLAVWGLEADKLLWMIRNHFQQIHKKLNDLPVKQKVPCVCPLGCTHQSNPYLHDYDTLQRFKLKGRRTRECSKEVLDVSIDAMLEGIIDHTTNNSQNLLKLIGENKIDDFFQELSIMGVAEHQLAQLKEEYISNGGDYKFTKRLKVWAIKYFENAHFETAPS